MPLKSKILTNRSQQHFVDTMIALVDAWTECFPDCETTKVYLNSLRELSDTEKNNLIKEWHTAMDTPINPKKAKYCKALERILTAPPSIYIACEYKDADVLFASVNSIELFDHLKLADKYKSEEVSNEDRSLLWRFIQELNRAALLCMEKQMQYVPSRDEIQENIRKHKQQRNLAQGPPSMTKAFSSAFISISELMSKENVEGGDDLKTFAQGLSDAEYNDLLYKWTTMTQETDMETACKENNIEQLISCKWSALDDKYEDCIKAGLKTLNGAVICNYLDQMNSFCRVQKHIPNGLMGRIEDYAFKLANDISSGTCDLSNLNLNQIGQDVLSGCDTNEMSALANNINELLPTLNSLRSGLPTTE